MSWPPGSKIGNLGKGPDTGVASAIGGGPLRSEPPFSPLESRLDKIIPALRRSRGELLGPRLGSRRDVGSSLGSSTAQS